MCDNARWPSIKCQSGTVLLALARRKQFVRKGHGRDGRRRENSRADHDVCLDVAAEAVVEHDEWTEYWYSTGRVRGNGTWGAVRMATTYCTLIRQANSERDAGTHGASV
jgi:hypothetical protein